MFQRSLNVGRAVFRSFPSHPVPVSWPPSGGLSPIGWLTVLVCEYDFEKSATLFVFTTPTSILRSP